MHSSCQFKKEARPVPALSPIRAGHRLAKSYGMLISQPPAPHFPPYLVVRMLKPNKKNDMKWPQNYEMYRHAQYGTTTNTHASSIY